MQIAILEQSIISIHAPHARSDHIFILSCGHRGFQSTLLMRGATQRSAFRKAALTFQSTLLMRGATPSTPCLPYSM